MDYCLKWSEDGRERRCRPVLHGECFEKGLRQRTWTAGEGAPLQLELLEECDQGTGARRCRLSVRGAGEPCRLGTLMIGMELEAGGVLDYYTADWGAEFEPASSDLSRPVELKVTSGRSSKGFAPWVGYRGPDRCLGVAVGWSGNWKARGERSGEKVLLWVGLDRSFFEKELAPGERFEGPELFCGCSDRGVEACAQGLRQFFLERAARMGEWPRETLPGVYNTWWCYEDRDVNEAVCMENAGLARAAGLTDFMLDAGWFGEEAENEGMDWFGKRGDWELVNAKRFPAGLASLGDAINGSGIRFGVWCEIEAVGEHARLLRERPELVARRDGESLGYVCMAGEETRRWAMEHIRTLVEEYGAKWIKFDFNLDPGAGCNQPGHGHGPGDGLDAHYKGYYRLLDEVHHRYPHVILENCSSGGLRMDLGMLRHTHLTFLSDPDYVEHHFQCFWGAVSYLPASCCYHFTQSECLGDHNGVKNPITPETPPHAFDYIIRSGMLCIPGFSYRLPGWTAWQLDRLKEHMAFYKEISRPYIHKGTLYRLTGQAIRGGKGDRWQAYQYTAADGSALVYLFRLPGGEERRRIPLRGLEESGRYRVEARDRGAVEERTGGQLMREGIAVDGMKEASSEILTINRL